MQSRCLNNDDIAYSKYGGDGITICDRWLAPNPQGFFNFLEDMGERPDGTSLNRVGGAKLYSKDTCAWATPNEQSFDQKLQSNNSSGKTGVCWKKKDRRWRAYIYKDNINISLGSYLNLEDAIKAREEAELKYYGFIKE
jgi:hypothetical protein